MSGRVINPQAGLELSSLRVSISPVGVSAAQAPGRGGTKLATWLRSYVVRASWVGLRQPEDWALYVWFLHWERGAE